MNESLVKRKELPAYFVKACDELTKWDNKNLTGWDQCGWGKFKKLRDKEISDFHERWKENIKRYASMYKDRGGKSLGIPDISFLDNIELTKAVLGLIEEGEDDQQV